MKGLTWSPEKEPSSVVWKFHVSNMEVMPGGEVMTQGLETGGGDELASIPNSQIQVPGLVSLERLLFPTHLP